MQKLRIGNGYDAHRLVAGRRLVIGGVHIDWHAGLCGHSDADVLLHAVCDACLGAAGLGDIGRHFPSDDDAYRNADSRDFVRHTRKLLAAAKLRAVNLDCIVVAQRPTLAPHIAAMRANIAADIGVADQCVNVKATTTDRLGFCGDEQGIAAHAVVLLESHE